MAMIPGYLRPLGGGDEAALRYGLALLVDGDTGVAPARRWPHRCGPGGVGAVQLRRGAADPPGADPARAEVPVEAEGSPFPPRPGGVEIGQGLRCRQALQIGRG